MTTGEKFRPDLVIVLPDNKTYILELTAGYEANLKVNVEGKRAKFQSLMETLRSKYTDINLVNLSISSLGIFYLSCSTFNEMCDALAVEMGHRCYLTSKLSSFERLSTSFAVETSREIVHSFSPSKMQFIVVFFLLLSFFYLLLSLVTCFIMIRLAKCNYLFKYG